MRSGLLDVGTDTVGSETFRSSARSTGSRQLVAFVSRMAAADRAESKGVSADGSPQPVAEALVAEASMRALSVESPEIWPLALREGLILRKLDTETDGDLVGRSK